MSVVGRLGSWHAMTIAALPQHMAVSRPIPDSLPMRLKRYSFPSLSCFHKSIIGQPTNPALTSQREHVLAQSSESGRHGRPLFLCLWTRVRRSLTDEFSPGTVRHSHTALCCGKAARKFLYTKSLVAVVTLILLAGATSIFAQTADRGWEWQNPRPQGNAISAIRFASDKLHGWAVGADGVILYTADGGFQWESQQTRLVAALNGLYVLDRQRALVVGAPGVVLTPRHAGARWIAVPTPTKDHLY